MSQVEWIKVGVDLLQAIIGGVFVGVVIYWLDERRAKRDRRLSDFRIASNWEVTQPKASLRNFQLHKANLSGYNLSKANLENTDLTKATLKATDFGSANLRKTDFSGAYFVGTNLIDVIAFDADFSKTKMRKEKGEEPRKVVEFSKANLSYSSFRNAEISEALFLKSVLKLTDFTGANISGCDFTDANLTGSKWKKVKRVENCLWKGVKGATRENFPKKLLEEIERQNAE